MSLAVLAEVDLSHWQEPDPGLDARPFLEDWLRYQRHEFFRKLRDLSAKELAAWAIPPVELSVIGLVRHMTQMEHVWIVCGLGGGDRALRYREDDYAGGTPDSFDDDLRWYFEEVSAADRAIAAVPTLETPSAGHGRSLHATLVKMIDEYAIHAGQAHMLRFATLGRLLR